MDQKITPNPTGIDAYKPAEVAQRIEDAGIAKAALPFVQLFTLAVLAGAFIAFGAAAYTATLAGADATFGPWRLLGGVAFSLGLVLVIVAGAELFTGNALIVMAWVDGRVSLAALLRNWAISYLGKCVGSLGHRHADVAVWPSRQPEPRHARRCRPHHCNRQGRPRDGKRPSCVASSATPLSASLSGLPLPAAVFTDKILAIIVPIAAFVLLGFEHSIANFYFFPAGLAAGAALAPGAIAANLLAVTAGNIIGGAGGVALTYWLAYRPNRKM